MMRRTYLPAKRDTPRRTGSPTPRIKPKQPIDWAWRRKLRAFGCWCCRVDGYGWVRAEVHHPRTGGKDGAGASQKAPDRQALPLCRIHHREQVPGFLSVHRHPIEWRARYGSEAEVLGHVLKAMEAEVAA